MELTPEDIEILDRFFRNELTAEEETVLQSRMKDKDFGKAAASYLETMNVIRDAGRLELRTLLSSVQKDVEKSDGFDNYKSSTPGKGSGGGGFIISILVVLIGLTAYFYFSGNLNTQKLQNIFPESDKPDTVYHYRILRDTFVVNKSDTTKKGIVIKSKSDTIFIRVRKSSNGIKMDTIKSDTLIQ